MLAKLSWRVFHTVFFFFLVIMFWSDPTFCVDVARVKSKFKCLWYEHSINVEVKVFDI